MGSRVGWIMMCLRRPAKSQPRADWQPGSCGRDGKWAFPQRTARESLVSITVVLQRCGVRGTFSCGGHAEKLAALLQLLLAMRVGKESVVANAVEPARQNVQEEASNELVC